MTPMFYELHCAVRAQRRRILTKQIGIMLMLTVREVMGCDCHITLIYLSKFKMHVFIRATLHLRALEDNHPNNQLFFKMYAKIIDRASIAKISIKTLNSLSKPKLT